MAIFKIQMPVWMAVLVLSVATGVFGRALISANDTYSYTINFPQGDEGLFLYGARPELARADFFKKTKEAFIEQGATFIEADLSAMKIRLYKEGKIIYDKPILTKGKEGSWWETPAGLYKIENKEREHYSSFGNVYMPSSMQFQGNFYIHGWPYHKDGRPVESSFSGGCIRLATDDAKDLFSQVEIGIPVLVYERDFESDEFAYALRVPEISAEQYLIADLKSNFIMAEKGSEQTRPIASLTKLVTALIATEYINIEKKISVPEQALIATSRSRLTSGQAVSVYSLLYPLLMESSNEAAETLSLSLGPNYFVNLMNEKAKALGMNLSHFDDASGLSEKNISTPQDLFNLTKYLYNNRKFILNITDGKVERPDLYGWPEFADLKNFNVFADDPRFVGGKIGKTDEAKETLLAVFEFTIREETRPVAMIILGSEEVASDGYKLLEYVEKYYFSEP